MGDSPLAPTRISININGLFAEASQLQLPSENTSSLVVQAAAGLLTHSGCAGPVRQACGPVRAGFHAELDPQASVVALVTAVLCVRTHGQQLFVLQAAD